MIGESIETYVSWMAEHGYANGSVYRRVRVLMRFVTFAQDRRVDRWGELSRHVDAFIAAWLGA